MSESDAGMDGVAGTTGLRLCCKDEWMDDPSFA